MQFRVLGPPEVVRDGQVVPLGGPKQRALLVLFLLRPNRFVAADWLVDALWDGRPPPSADITLRTYVAGLRRAVEPHRSPARRPASCGADRRATSFASILTASTRPGSGTWWTGRRSA